MIVNKIRPWVPINGITHDKTTWQISDHEDFSNILDEVQESDVWIDTYISVIDLPPGATYYVRAKRHFSSGDSSDWLVKRIRKLDTSGIYLADEISVDTPMVYVSKEDLLDNTKTTITVKSSSYRGKGDGHSYSNWVVVDNTGDILFNSIKDTTNLTEIEIEKSLLNVNKVSELRFYVAHGTGLGIESEFGYKNVKLDSFNFIIENNLNKIIPYNDYRIKITNINGEPNNIYRWVLRDLNNNIIWESNVNEITEIVLKGDFLEPSSTYILDLYVKQYNADDRIKSITLQTLPKDEYKYIPNYKYDNVLESILSKPQFIQNDVITEEFYTGIVPVPKSGSNSCDYYEYNNSNNTLNTLSGLNILDIPTTNRDNIKIELLEDNKLLVDYLDNNGDPTFAIYKYNSFYQSTTLLRTIVRDDESNTTAFNNNLIFVNSKEAVYLPNQDTVTKLKKLNIETGEITELTPLTSGNISGGNIAYIGNGKILVIHTSFVNSMVYDINKNEWYFGPTIPYEFKDRPLKQISLVNGNVLYIKTTDVENTDNNNVMIYDNEYETFNIINIDNPSLTESYDSVIKLKNGKVILCTNKDNVTYMTLFR